MKYTRTVTPAYTLWPSQLAPGLTKKRLPMLPLLLQVQYIQHLVDASLNEPTAAAANTVRGTAYVRCGSRRRFVISQPMRAAASPRSQRRPLVRFWCRFWRALARSCSQQVAWQACCLGTRRGRRSKRGGGGCGWSPGGGADRRKTIQTRPRVRGLYGYALAVHIYSLVAKFNGEFFWKQWSPPFFSSSPDPAAHFADDGR